MTTDIAPPVRTGWTGTLWRDMEQGYRDILTHPFIEGLTTGELDHAAFGRFLVQDAYYIREYSRALAVLAGKAPDVAAMQSMLKHAAGSVAAESELHEKLAVEVGLSRDDLRQAKANPVAAAYVDFMLARIYEASFLEGVATVLPCMWIYAEVGRHLVTAGSPDPVYARWIENYADGDFAGEVADLLDVLDRAAGDIGAREDANARANAVTATRYEWMFWDAAFRDVAWPAVG